MQSGGTEEANAGMNAETVMIIIWCPMIRGAVPKCPRTVDEMTIAKGLGTGEMTLNEESKVMQGFYVM